MRSCTLWDHKNSYVLSTSRLDLIFICSERSCRITTNVCLFCRRPFSTFQRLHNNNNCNNTVVIIIVVNTLVHLQRGITIIVIMERPAYFAIIHGIHWRGFTVPHCGEPDVRMTSDRGQSGFDRDNAGSRIYKYNITYYY